MYAPLIMIVVFIKLDYPKIDNMLIKIYNYIEGCSYEK